MTRAEAQDFSGVHRLGILGGSFDPVHRGHLHAARAAREACDLDRVVFVPAARPPHKPERVLAEGADRLAMVELAIADFPEYSVSPLELDRSGPSYSVDTARALPGRLGLADDAELFWILGWDNLEGLDRWREVDALFERARPITVLRRGVREDVLDELRAGLSPRSFERLLAGLVRVPTADVSSTELRERLRRGEPVDELLPPGVGEYAAARAIYRPAP